MYTPPWKSPIDLLHLQPHLLRVGYVVAVRDNNAACAWCTELTLLRIRCPNTGVYTKQYTKLYYDYDSQTKK